MTKIAIILKLAYQMLDAQTVLISIFEKLTA
jgi:hypothetical protein